MTYGSSADVYLNGLTITSAFAGDVYTQQLVVTQRGSVLDGSLNTNSIFEIQFNGTGFKIATHN